MSIKGIGNEKFIATTNVNSVLLCYKAVRPAE